MALIDRPEYPGLAYLKRRVSYWLGVEDERNAPQVNPEQVALVLDIGKDIPGIYNQDGSESPQNQSGVGIPNAVPWSYNFEGLIGQGYVGFEHSGALPVVSTLPWHYIISTRFRLSATSFINLQYFNYIYQSYEADTPLGPVSMYARIPVNMPSGSSAYNAIISHQMAQHITTASTGATTYEGTSKIVYEISEPYGVRAWTYFGDSIRSYGNFLPLPRAVTILTQIRGFSVDRKIPPSWFGNVGSEQGSTVTKTEPIMATNYGNTATLGAM